MSVIRNSDERKESPFFIGFGFWFCFVVFSFGVKTKLGLQKSQRCRRYVSRLYFATMFVGYVMVVHWFYAE